MNPVPTIGHWTCTYILEYTCATLGLTIGASGPVCIRLADPSELRGDNIDWYPSLRWTEQGRSLTTTKLDLL